MFIYIIFSLMIMITSIFTYIRVHRYLTLEMFLWILFLSIQWPVAFLYLVCTWLFNLGQDIYILKPHECSKSLKGKIKRIIVK